MTFLEEGLLKNEHLGYSVRKRLVGHAKSKQTNGVFQS